MRKITLLLLLLGVAASAQEVVNGNRYYTPGTGTATQVPNASSTGTTVNKLAKLTGTGTAVIAATTDTSGAIGVVAGGAGTSGNADIIRDGQASLVFDGATTANDYVQISSTTGGDGHDAGSTCPSSGQVIGRVLSTNGSGGTYTIIVGSSGCGGGSGGSGTINAASQYSDPYYSASGSATAVSGLAAPTGPDGVPQTKVSVPSSGLATAPQFALPGVAGRAVTGTTSTDTILATDCNPYRVTYIGSVSVAVTLPTATTLSVPNCAFKVVNGTSGSSTTVTITPTTWTISAGGGSTGASLVIAQGQEATVFVDPNSATNWVADVTEQALSAGSGIALTRSPSGLSVAATAGGGGTVTSVGTSSPLTGGPITGSGTIACATCATGPGSSTANHIAEFSGTDGVTLKDGGAAPTGTVTSVGTAGIATGGSITTSGTVTVAGSGNTTTAVTATAAVATAPVGEPLIADGSGNAAPFTPLTTVGTGGVYSNGWPMSFGINGTTTGTPTNNTFYAHQFNLFLTQVIGHATFNVSTGGTAETMYVCLYNSAGTTLLWSANATVTATAIASASAAQYTAQPGHYIVMYGQTGTTAAVVTTTAINAATGNILNQNGTRIATSSVSVATGPGCPSGVGTLTAVQTAPSTMLIGLEP